MTDADQTLPAVPESRIGGWLKEASQHSMIYGIGAAMQAAVNVCLLPLYTRLFRVEQFGVLNQAQLTATLAGAVCYLGGYSALSRFYFDSTDPEERRRVAGTATIITLAGAVLLVCSVVLFRHTLSQLAFDSPNDARYLVVACSTTAVAFVNQILLLMLRLQRRSVAVVSYNLVAVIVTVGAVVSLTVVWPLGLIGALGGSLVGQLAIAPVLLWSVRDLFVWRAPARLLRSQLAFGLPAVVIGLGYYALDGADRIVLAHRSTATDLGLYSFGYRIGLVAQMLFVQPFVQIWNPIRIEHRAHAEAPRLMALVTTYYAMSGLALVATLSLFSHEIVAIVGKPEYAPAARVVPIILLSHLTYGAVNLIDIGIVATNRLYYHIVLFWSSLVLNVALNLYLVPRYGYMGSAWATLASYALLVVAVYLVADRLMKIHVEPARLAILLTTAVATILVGQIAPASRWPAMAWHGALLVALVATWYRFVLQSEERRWCRQMMGRVSALATRPAAS